MEIKQLLRKLITPALFILIGAIARILPHAPNFAPIGAMALFGGTYMGKKEAFALPILAMILSDLFIGFDSIPMRLTVYGSFLLIVFIGFWLKKYLSIKNVAISSLSASILFFVTTNFAVWAFGSLYPHSLSGLVDSYSFALPFFKNTLAGDFFYSGAFFGVYNLFLNTSRRGAWLQKA